MVKAIVGANWEMKVRVRLLICSHRVTDIIIRFQGGANAGHTIYK